MEPTQIIIIIAAIILSFMALKFVTKILFRLILVLIMLIVFYMGYQHFSGTNIFDNISKLCQNEKDLKCICFTQPILNDLNSRYKSEEIEEIKNNKLKCNIEFGRSFQAQELNIKKCFEKYGETSLLEEILSEIRIKNFLFKDINKEQKENVSTP